MHSYIHCSYSIRAVPFQCRLASKSSNINITSTQRIQQTGIFSQPWRLSQPPESSAGQSAVDHLYEGPGHLSLQVAAAGLEWKPGPEALLLVCPAMHLNHELRCFATKLTCCALQQNSQHTTWDAVSHVNLFQCYSGTAWLRYFQGLMARCQLSAAHWPATQQDNKIY